MLINWEDWVPFSAEGKAAWQRQSPSSAFRSVRESFLGAGWTLGIGSACRASSSFSSRLVLILTIDVFVVLFCCLPLSMRLLAGVELRIVNRSVHSVRSPDIISAGDSCMITNRMENGLVTATNRLNVHTYITYLPMILKAHLLQTGSFVPNPR